jgi:MurNAc alpha-1-phosphate uridylyltransferase
MAGAGFRAQAMLLAAGRGERMRPLTDHTPKPLLEVRSRPLLWYPLQALALAGVPSAVINTGWLGDQIEPAFGSGFSPSVAGVDMTPAANLQLRYSHEGRGAGEALETAGGIVRALPLLNDVFWVAAGDVFAPDFAFSALDYERFKASLHWAHIWLVPNPAHNPRGDFGLSAQGLALNLPKLQAGLVSPVPESVSAQPPRAFPSDPSQPLFTFSTIALYKRAFFEAAWCPIPAGNPDGVKAPLAPMLRAAMDQGLVSASLYEGLWVDVGTPERLAQLNE